MADSLKPKNKIAILSSNRWNSAITEYAISCAKSLIVASKEVTFLPLINSPAIFRAETEFPQYGKTYHIEALNYFSLSSYIGFFRFYKRKKPDIVITLGGKETSLATFFKKFIFKNLIIVRVLGDLPRNHHAFYSLRHHLSHGLVDSYIAVCERLEMVWKPYTKTKHVSKILLGLDLSKKQSPGNNESVFQDGFSINTKDFFNFLVLGRLDPIKGHAFILDVMAELKRIWPIKNKSFKLHIIGQSANVKESDILSTVQKLNLTHEVNCCFQRVENIYLTLERFDLGIVPSLGSEFICRVTQEFLLAGVPVFLSSAGSLQECLLEGGFGSAYSLDDSSKEVALKLLSLVIVLNERNERKEKEQQTIRQKAEKHFSINSMSSNLLRALDR